MASLRTSTDQRRRRSLPGAGFFWTSSDLIAGAFLIAVAALVVIPLANLVRIALSGESDIWADLVAYVIPEALRVTVLLLAGVAALTALDRRRRRVARHRLSLSRPRYARLGARAAARLPDLHRRLRLRRHLRRVRPGAEHAARADRLEADARLLVSEHPLAARRDLRLLAGALSVRVPRRARDVPDAERVPVRGRAHARRHAFHAGAPRRAAARAARRSRSGCRWRCSKR